MDSTGVPHILEHTVLCGSKKYPIRDPFFKMLNRSLSTFMNAFTGMYIGNVMLFMVNAIYFHFCSSGLIKEKSFYVNLLFLC